MAVIITVLEIAMVGVVIIAEEIVKAHNLLKRSIEAYVPMDAPESAFSSVVATVMVNVQVIVPVLYKKAVDAVAVVVIVAIVVSTANAVSKCTVLL